MIRGHSLTMFQRLRLSDFQLTKLCCFNTVASKGFCSLKTKRGNRLVLWPSRENMGWNAKSETSQVNFGFWDPTQLALAQMLFIWTSTLLRSCDHHSEQFGSLYTRIQILWLMLMDKGVQPLQSLYDRRSRTSRLIPSSKVSDDN